MSTELFNILSQSNKDIDNQKLMDYLSNKLSQDDKHAVEKEMIDSALLNDAIEGLQNFKNTQDVSIFVNQLNANLQKQLKVKKIRKQKRKLKDQPWVILAIILILLLIAVSFIVIRKHLES